MPRKKILVKVMSIEQVFDIVLKLTFSDVNPETTTTPREETNLLFLIEVTASCSRVWTITRCKVELYILTRIDEPPAFGKLHYLVSMLPWSLDSQWENSAMKCGWMKWTIQVFRSWICFQPVQEQCLCVLLHRIGMPEWPIRLTLDDQSCEVEPQ